MKLNAALAKTLLMAASIGIVIPVGAQSSAARNTASKPAAPGSKTESTPAEGETTEAEITLPGAVVERAGGGFLSLTIEGGNFKLSFYDEKKKPIAPNVVRATARWEEIGKSGERRSVLNASGDALVGNVFVRPPFRFRVFLVLLAQDGSVAESHAVDFRG